jgi:hypothetical protein
MKEGVLPADHADEADKNRKRVGTTKYNRHGGQAE